MVKVTASWGLSLGPVRIEFGSSELKAIRPRFSRNALYRGPVMILNRKNGLALDAGDKGKIGAHTCLYQAHGAPWQQWRLNASGSGAIEIVSEPTGQRLTTMTTGYEWGETWLHNRRPADQSTSWRLRTTEDGVAFLIENAQSRFAFDAGAKATDRDPHMWPITWSPQQQWLILRLPLT